MYYISIQIYLVLTLFRNEQLVLLLVLLFAGTDMFGNKFLRGDYCMNWEVTNENKAENLESIGTESIIYWPQNSTNVGKALNSLWYYPDTKCGDFYKICGESNNGEVRREH